MPNGILIINKAPDWTSMDVCAKLRGILGERRIGHAGTLDPMATGVLPVFVGRATRAVEFASQSDKEYVAGLKLGVITDTQDTSGRVLEQRPVDVSSARLEALLPRFTGEIQQVPPMYSAIKINGKKLYELARKGREVERAPRPVTIHALTLEGQPARDCYLLRVRCSKGTYVRTLCHDLGQALGCGGAMYSLERTMACGFSLSDALTLEQVQASADPQSLLLPVDSFFSQYPPLTIPPDAEKRVRNGAACPLSGYPGGTYRVYAPDGAFLMLGRVEGGRLSTVKSFFAV